MGRNPLRPQQKQGTLAQLSRGGRHAISFAAKCSQMKPWEHNTWSPVRAGSTSKGGCSPSSPGSGGQKPAPSFQAKPRGVRGWFPHLLRLTGPAPRRLFSRIRCHGLSPPLTSPLCPLRVPVTTWGQHGEPRTTSRLQSLPHPCQVPVPCRAALPGPRKTEGAMLGGHSSATAGPLWERPRGANSSPPLPAAGHICPGVGWSPH